MAKCRCKLREVLKLRNMTQHELAEKTGLSDSAISVLAAGKRNGTIDTAVIIMNALKVDFYDLWEV